MKEKWLSVQKNCKFKYHISDDVCCSLGRQGIPCTIENCQIFKFAEALFSEPKPKSFHPFYDLDNIRDKLKEDSNENWKSLFTCPIHFWCEGVPLKIDNTVFLKNQNHFDVVFKPV